MIWIRCGLSIRQFHHTSFQISNLREIKAIWARTRYCVKFENLSSDLNLDTDLDLDLDLILVVENQGVSTCLTPTRQLDRGVESLELEV